MTRARLHLILAVAFLLFAAALTKLFACAPADVCNWGGPSCEVTR